jgi:hypothetical protein
VEGVETSSSGLQLLEGVVYFDQGTNLKGSKKQVRVQEQMEKKTHITFYSRTVM